MTASAPDRRSSPIRSLAALFAVGVVAAAIGSGTASAKEPKTQKTDVLFVVEGQQASTVAGDGGLELTIAGVDPDVLYFSDRPARNAGTIQSSELFAAWDSLGFEDDPPNAAVVMQQGPKGRRPTAVELGTPQYDAATATVTFPLSALSGQETSWLRALTEEHATTHGTIDLFVDTSPIELKFVNDSATGHCFLVFQPPPDAKECKP